MADAPNSHPTATRLKKQSSREAFVSKLEQFDFTGDAIDIALRKLLARVQLPKESQQIDRAIEVFAKRYTACNPDLIDSHDAVYATAFSILLLHTDAHNKNVRQKMNKETFISHTQAIVGGKSVPVELLDVMYDNIVIQEFTYAEQPDLETRAPEKTSWFPWLAKSEPMLQPAPFLEDLYPKLKQLMPSTNTFRYKREPTPVNVLEIHAAFSNAQPLRLGGVRSSHQTGSGTNRTYTVRVAKVGLIERKNDLLAGGKKATARGWRPMGIILSGSQIIFFSDVPTFESYFYSGSPSPHVDALSSLPRDDSTATLTNQSSPTASPKTAFSLSPHPSPVLSRSSSLSKTPLPQPSLSSPTISTSRPTLTTIATIDSTHSFSSHLSSSTYNMFSTTPLLRPVQIISLADAYCVHDESYTKYPNVFRLIAKDGQQFLIRTDTEKELDDWMAKINYASMIKTLGIRLRIGPSHRGADWNNFQRAADQARREDAAKIKLAALAENIKEVEQRLQTDLQLRRNLLVMTPLQKATKERILGYGEAVGKRIQQHYLDLLQLECYKEYLEQALHVSSTEISGKTGTSFSPWGRRAGPRLMQRSTTTPLLQHDGHGHDGSDHVHVNKQDTQDTGGDRHETPNHAQSSDTTEHPQEDYTTTDKNGRRLSCPQLPPMELSKPLFEGEITRYYPNPAPSDTKEKSDKDKSASLDKWIRRRSSSNPLLLRSDTEPLISRSTPTQSAMMIGNRERSSSTTSSVRDDEEELTVIHMNGSEDSLEPCLGSWTLT